jgi:hypothetical protein
MTARGRFFATAAVVVIVATSAGVTSIGAAETTKPERVARRFLDAYGSFQAERALKLLTADAVATGAGNSGNRWGSRDAFRQEVALAKAFHVRQIVSGCERQGESSDGVSVRCAYAYHALRSDEVGLGPYGDSYWDLVVRNGKITSAVPTVGYITNGFSAERWEPFQRWVTGTHPEDLPTLYPVGEFGISKETIRLWDRRTREWVAEEKGSAS